MPPKESTDPQLERALARAGVGLAKKTSEQEPLYRVVGDSRIPVSKAAGLLWESRKNQGLSSRSNAELNWDEAIAYYDNDQSGHRTSSGGRAGNVAPTRLGNQYTETENVVFANCSIMVPMLYAKNPHVSVTTENDANMGRAQALERLLNKLLSMKNAPGLNFKRKARRLVLTALLTNAGFVKIGWTKKDDSSEEAIRQLQDLSKELEEAKTRKEIVAVEGKITALEERIALLGPSGPWAKTALPHRIIIDPTAVEPDGSDANWYMEWDFLPTAYINAVYTTKEGDQHKAIYEPTHVVQAGNDATDIENMVNNFSLLSDSAEAGAYGYSNEAAFKAAQYTKVWYVWDRTTRRVLMFADNKWKWPLWVWDDPLKLPRFFPYFRLWFHESTHSNAPKGEVSYYLDQQDAINEIADEVRRGRQWAKRNIFFNQDILSIEAVEDVLKGDDGTARGVRGMPEGTKLEDHIFSFTPPGLKMPEFFSPDSKFQAINRITGINDAMRGAQYKTNTTNKAIDQYNTNVDIRVDERTDLIEDCIGEVAWNIGMLCLMNWEREDVAPFIGEEYAAQWQKVTDPRDFERLFAARVEGGTTEKPNSRGKREQAITIVQGLGQFAQAAPASVVVALKVLERSFDEVVISDEEWASIHKSIEMALTKAGGGPGGSGEQDTSGGLPTAAGTDEQLTEQVRQRLAALPPAAQDKLQELVQGGMPPSEALEQVEADLQPQPQQ